MEPIISIKNLSVVYDKGTQAEVSALSNISLDIFPGEFVIVFGPSGCGKSTLLYAISGAERRITDGDLWIKGKNLRTIDGEDMIDFHRKSVGIVFQAYNLIPTINVFDNIILPLIFRGVPKKERTEKGKELMEKFKIGHLARTRPSLLSGGQQQRVGIARALVNDTEILLADEPTGNLDSQAAFSAMDMFAALNMENKKTIILVTHESQYLPYASRIVHMKDGKIISDYKQEKKRVSSVVLIKEGEKANNNDSLEIAISVDRLLSFLKINLTAEESVRFNETMRNYAGKKIGAEDFRKTLDIPYKDGGLGLYFQTAAAVSQEIGDIMKVSSMLSRDENKEISKKTEIVFSWLFSDYTGGISEIQKKKIKEAIIKRMKGKCSLFQFQNELDRPLKDGGSGLNYMTAKNIAQKIGLIF